MKVSNEALNFNLHITSSRNKHEFFKRIIKESIQ